MSECLRSSCRCAANPHPAGALRRQRRQSAELQAQSQQQSQRQALVRGEVHRGRVQPVEGNAMEAADVLPPPSRPRASRANVEQVQVLHNAERAIRADPHQLLQAPGDDLQDLGRNSPRERLHVLVQARGGCSPLAERSVLQPAQVYMCVCVYVSMPRPGVTM